MRTLWYALIGKSVSMEIMPDILYPERLLACQSMARNTGMDIPINAQLVVRY